MTWNEGHPPHWCAEMVSLGYPEPPEKHNFEKGRCTFCGHPDPSAENPVQGVCVE